MVLALLAGAAYFAFGKKTFSAIEVVHPVKGPAVEAVYATGTVEATVMLPVAAKGTARLIKLLADEGSEVKKGQVLAQLDDEDLQNSLNQLQVQEDYAKSEYERYVSLVASGTAARATLDKAKSTWEAAKAATARAKVEVGYMQLVAPADGRIIRRDGEMGQLIPSNQAVFWLSCCAPLRVSAEVDEEDIMRVAPGQPVLIRADAFPGKIFHGKVQAITPKGDPVARSYRVRIEFSQEVPLQIGMTAESNIIISETKDALLVPSSAVSQDKLWLVRDGKLQQKAVVVGAKGAEQTEIREGLGEGDVVARKFSLTWKDGQPVNTTFAEKTGP